LGSTLQVRARIEQKKERICCQIHDFFLADWLTLGRAHFVKLSLDSTSYFRHSDVSLLATDCLKAALGEKPVSEKRTSQDLATRIYSLQLVAEMKGANQE